MQVLCLMLFEEFNICEILWKRNKYEYKPMFLLFKKKYISILILLHTGLLVDSFRLIDLMNSLLIDYNPV